ncbi:MAG: site-2 protease family protein [Pseudomonadota bacterium]|nr:site-2 protease family protein [Pseudomonadota bacterium]
MQGMGLIGLLVVVLLVHEMGHAMMLSWYRVAPKGVALGVGWRLFSWGKWQFHALPLGGEILVDEEEILRLPQLRRLLIPLGGSLANFVLALFCRMWLGKQLGSASEQVWVLVLMDLNLVLGCFNLLPLPFLDGWTFLHYLDRLPQWVQTVMIFFEVLFTIACLFWLWMQFEGGWPVFHILMG